MKSVLHLAALAFALAAATAAASTTPELGIRDNTPTLTAFTNARIVVSPDLTLESAALVMKDGIIRAVGESIAIPVGARIVDLQGRTIYPGFIDPCTDYGLPANEARSRRWGAAPKYYADRIGGSAWNEAIHGEVDGADSFCPDSAKAEALLRLGFTTVQTARLDGIFRGRSAVALLRQGLPNDQFLRPRSSHFVSFSKGTSSQDYPSSLMGAIVLIRQMLLDVQWYNAARRAWDENPAQEMPEFNSAIEALAENPADTLFFFANSELDILRAARLAAEFNRTIVAVGSGSEYKRIDEIEALGIPIVIPLDFPEPPPVKSLEDELDVTLGDLRHWERAPANPAVLERHGITFALTAKGENPKKFIENLRTSVRYGLSEKAALRALTVTPARLCGVDRSVGTLEPGKLASFIVCDGNLFADTTSILATWVAGERHEFTPLDASDFRGSYFLTLVGDSAELVLEGKPTACEGSLVRRADTLRLSDVQVERDRISFRVKDAFAIAGIHRFSGRASKDSLAGKAALPDGQWVDWLAIRTSTFIPDADSTARESTSSPEFVSRLTYPNRAWGLESIPPIQDVLIQHATIWTCDEAGILEDADLLMRSGRIAAVGKDLAPPEGVTVIDATGKHLTPGIIDEHSHTAISGDVNEGTHAITPEVRIEDILDPDDINIYRQLAGGTTTARLLHGSANPIGGQAALVKWRWGMSADSLLFRGAPPAMKFALGENVKQSGWGERFNTRYPQTRLGVDAILRDAFQAARSYEKQWAAYTWLSKTQQRRTIPPRRDLQLEALVDVLNGRIAAHCHGYVATEMLMFIRLAREFGFTVQSFAHGLEGYKIAAELAAAGVGVGSIADWWAYKFETYDGIPQSPALMTEKGVLVAINSDSPDLARRLPQEAAKSIMYAGMSPEEALKMVTINPARLMGIENRVGSITTGKDADFVIWNGPPMSIYSHPEQTWLDGRKYFDIGSDSLMRAELATEKRQLVQKALEAKAPDGRKSSPDSRHPAPPDNLDLQVEGGGRHETR